jgi:hypothetical protein
VLRCVASLVSYSSWLIALPVNSVLARASSVCALASAACALPSSACAWASAALNGAWSITNNIWPLPTSTPSRNPTCWTTPDTRGITWTSWIASNRPT